MSSARIPSPGPSFARAEPLRLRGTDGGLGQRVELKMSKPSIMDDGWWLTNLWVEDEDGIVPAIAVVPLGGAPPGQTLQVIGPIFAGALMGLLAQSDDRQLIRLRMPPAEDASHPWERPLMLWVAVSWDPIRSSTMTTNELAGELIRAFRQAVDSAGAPGRTQEAH